MPSTFATGAATGGGALFLWSTTPPTMRAIAAITATLNVITIDRRDGRVELIGGPFTVGFGPFLGVAIAGSVPVAHGHQSATSARADRYLRNYTPGRIVVPRTGE